MESLTLLRTVGKTLYLSVKRKKLSLRFVNSEVVQRVYELLSALLSMQKEKPLETEIKELCQSQPSLSQRDWKVLEEVARQHSASRDSPRGHDAEDPLFSQRTEFTFLTDYSFGDTIATKDQLRSCIVRILDGSCSAERTLIDKENRVNFVTLRTFGMDEVVGEASFFVNEPSYFSVVANEATVKVLEVSRSFIETTLFAQNPDSVVRFYDYFCRTLASRLSRALPSVPKEILRRSKK